MKVTRVIVSTDGSPKYDRFWELIAPVCQKRLGVAPVLIKIGGYDSGFESDKWGLSRTVAAAPELPTAFQAQVARMYGASFFRNEVCLVSDLDMLLISREYFIDQVKDIPSDAWVVYSSDYRSDRYPLCYNAALGSTFAKVLTTDCAFSEYARRLYSFDSSWFCDEKYFTERLRRSEVPTVCLKRGWLDGVALNRIDRAQWEWDAESLEAAIDCHLPRPYCRHAATIDRLVDAVMRSGV